MEYKISISEAVTKGKALGPIIFSFDEVYSELNKRVSELNQLVNHQSTRRPIAYLSIDQLKNIPVIERNLLEIYNDEADKFADTPPEIGNIVKGAYGQCYDATINKLRFEINNKVKSLFKDGEFLGDIKVNFSINDLNYKNYPAQNALKLIVDKISESEDHVLEEKKRELKNIIKDYFTVRAITFMDNGKEINYPNIEVW
ncbi:hypothetical protein A8F94_14250 [Bacillus sp. FJAT-27225]|uniref:hypothetical protein n=1 Tax=Bacillus sp. FJAT-27225 TaxID=1743144 RepID=UPI00080C3086|nr:hypothetical protein [Bacillus sp. FJAT-27225]OCA86003.1 hypothetical protein A8F94_14250 [Bacillus sp. FJAT-27225]